MTLRLGALGVALLAACVLGLFVGAAGLTPSEVVDGLTRSGASEGVIWNIRMPRILGGVLVGACLGIGGVALQGVFRNRLADPYLLGLSSSAALGLVMGTLASAGPATEVIAVTAALATATTTAVLLHRLSYRTIDGNQFVLAGLVVGLVVLAWTLLIIFAADTPRLPTFTYFVFGGLGSTTWESVLYAAPLAIFGSIAIRLKATSLDVMALGDAEAKGLGVDVTRGRLWLLASTAAVVAAAVSVAGVVGFVGLLAPMTAARVVGFRSAPLTVASLLSGALMVVLIDDLIRATGTIVEVPLGVVSAAIGGPILIVALMTRASR